MKITQMCNLKIKRFYGNLFRYLHVGTTVPNSGGGHIDNPRPSSLGTTVPYRGRGHIDNPSPPPLLV